jgi:DNA replication protein DnaC
MKIFVALSITKEGYDMLNQNIINQCSQLKLFAFQEELALQSKNNDIQSVSFEERIELTLNAQVNNNHDSKVQRLLKKAKLRYPHADINNLPYEYWKKANKLDITRHFDCGWVSEGRNLAIIGPTGSGKTHLACALAKEAIYNEIPVLFQRFVDLILLTTIAEKEGELHKFRRQLNRYPVIIIDDWAIKKLTDVQRHLLYDFIEERDENSSFLITSQYPVDKWHGAFSDLVVADSVIDRVKNHSYFINTFCDISLREVFGIPGGSNEK